MDCEPRSPALHPEGAFSHLIDLAMLITRRAEFSASHSCYNPAFTEEENFALYGERPDTHGHGHNYVLEVTLEGEPDPQTGMVYDLKRLKEVIQRQVLDPMDHRHLNREVPPFDKIVPTAENLAREIWNRLEPALKLPAARLHSIRVFETEDHVVEYSG